jgi:NDP-sugar pyrophosphorylase family protein
MIGTALILAAGLGTRLAPLSSLRAKAALPVAGEVLIRRQVRWLAAAGVTRIIVNLHHRPSTITAVLGHGDDLGVTVRYSWESVVLGSAGGPRRALDLVEADRFFIVNGDTLTDLDLAALHAAHLRARPLVTLGGSPTVPAGYNALLADGDGRLLGVRRAGSAEATPHDATPVHFVGVQMVERRVFADVPESGAWETIPWLYPRLLNRDADSVRVWTSRASFRDVQTPADYLETVQAVAAGEGRALDRGAGGRIAASARLQGTICWDEVEVGEAASLVDCVVGDGARVPDGLHAHRACLVPASRYTGGQADRVAGEVVVVPFAAPAAG